ncbi:MAG: hypothetical protein M3R08_00265 [Bacteroidota bacterium]|nr:hypothetical protein [Bacteroidota bacterium]
MKYSSILIIVVLLASCSSTTDVVQDGPFQKRKYFKKGWFFDRPVNRGSEEFELAEAELDPEPVHASDPYLKMLPAEMLLIDTTDAIKFPALDLRSDQGLPARVSLSNSSFDAPAPRVAPTTRSTIFSPLKRAGLIDDELQRPIIATTLALLLPVVLLVALLILIKRMFRSPDGGSTAAVVALGAGMMGLAALAML